MIVGTMTSFVGTACSGSLLICKFRCNHGDHLTGQQNHCENCFTIFPHGLCAEFILPGLFLQRTSTVIDVLVSVRYFPVLFLDLVHVYGDGILCRRSAGDFRRCTRQEVSNLASTPVSHLQTNSKPAPWECLFVPFVAWQLQGWM